MLRDIWAEATQCFGIDDQSLFPHFVQPLRHTADVIEDQAIGHQMIVLDQFALLVPIILLQDLPAKGDPL